MKRSVIPIAAALIFVSCGKAPPPDVGDDAAEAVITGSMALEYAEQFSVDYRSDGCSVIRIGEDSFMFVPEGAEIPDDTQGMRVIEQPAGNIYLAASSAMDLFDGLGELDRVTMTSTEPRNWSLPNVLNAFSEDKLTYIGKYSAPDYEALVESDCPLAIESTMIYHSPEVKEKIEQLGIPVMVERSSYETHPLGRMEWIKLYGLLVGKSGEAERIFAEKAAVFEALSAVDIPEDERRTAAFFYISSNGSINVRKPGDYISKMIELAGGRYILTADDLSIDENALSTMNIQPEVFYELARDADILIYNSTIEGGIESTSQLTEKCAILADFKAVKEGRVWCTEQDMFQQTTGAADMIADLNRIFTGDTSEGTVYLHQME